MMSTQQEENKDAYRSVTKPNNTFFFFMNKPNNTLGTYDNAFDICQSITLPSRGQLVM